MILPSLLFLIKSIPLTKEMVYTEAASRVAPKLYQAGKEWILSSFSGTTSSDNDHHEDEISDQNPQQHSSESKQATSTEYLVHNWLEALFAWFQVIVLWHEPVVSIYALSGLLTSFLLLTYLAPKFYAAIMIALFVYNANKFWFRHVWPSIRVPPEQGREEEMIMDVDRWTYLHPQLMTTAELGQLIKNLMVIFGQFLNKLLRLRQEKPVLFCSAVCSLFFCTACIGNRISGINIVFFGLITLLTSPGIYQHLLPDSYKFWFKQKVCLRVLKCVQLESNEDEVSSSNMPMQELSKELTPLSRFASRARSIETQALSLFEFFKRGRSNLQDSSSENIDTNVEESDVPTLINSQQSQTNLDSGQQEKQKQNIIVGDTSDLRSQHKPKRASDDMSSHSSTSLIDSDDDQQDGFVLL